MTDHSPRLFSTDAEITRIGKGLLARALPKESWTHEAHLAACTWIVRDCPEINPEHDFREIISRYNESVGGVNSDTEGYHETITQVFIAAVRDHLSERPAEESLCACVNALLVSDRGRRDWPLRFYTRERLFSVEARRGFVAPDRG
ncbi:MAG: hypothetical protein U1E64_14425 [Sphingomonadaceae bacterium]